VVGILIPVAEVDYCFFERIQTRKKFNFDFTLVNKDYSQPPWHISAIDNEYLEKLKEFCNQQKLI